MGKKFDRPDLVGKPMNIHFQLYNLSLMLSRRNLDFLLENMDIDEKLTLPENFSNVINYENYVFFEINQY
jgi:hypothetical protein